MSAATVFGNDGPVGWVPTLYVAPASALNLERHLWYVYQLSIPFLSLERRRILPNFLLQKFNKIK
jgi:hypothetical protein